MAGRKPKLTTDKSDRKYQRDRTEQLQKHDKALPDLQPTPPADLKGVARTAYTKIVKQLNNQGFIKQLDLNLVVSLCREIQIARDAYKNIFEGDPPKGTLLAKKKTLQGPGGKKVGEVITEYYQNPAVKTLESATRSIKSLSETLGMTPTSRASLLELTKTSDDDDVDISEVLSQNKADF